MQLYRNVIILHTIFAIITISVDGYLLFCFSDTAMQKVILGVALIAAILVLGVTCQDAMLAPPDRPQEFRSPTELRQYLKALNDYYAIVGRPR
jgi:hypothetical protein